MDNVLCAASGVVLRVTPTETGMRRRDKNMEKTSQRRSCGKAQSMSAAPWMAGTVACTMSLQTPGLNGGKHMIPNKGEDRSFISNKKHVIKIAMKACHHRSGERPV